MSAEALASLVRTDGWKILDSVPESVLITDAALDRPGSSILYVNQAFERMTGWSREEILGQSPGLLHGPLTDPAILEGLRNDPDAGRNWRGRGVNYRRDGQPYWLDWSITPIFCGQTQPSYFVAVQRDVSKEVETEARAVEALLAKHDFLAMMTHELRTPLSIIIGYANLLSDPDLTDLSQIKRGADLIRQNADSLLTTAEDFLDHARSGSGTIELDVADLDLRLQIQNSITALAPSAEMRGATIALAPGGPEIVTADERRVGQILRNLIVNAIKHGREGGRIDVAVSGDVDGATILISDDGPGVPEKMRSRVFEPFVQLRSSTGGGKGGVGLGLAIVQRFMNLHAGTVEILPRSGGGTTLRLWFPRRQGGGSVS